MPLQIYVFQKKKKKKKLKKKKNCAVETANPSFMGKYFKKNGW